ATTLATNDPTWTLWVLDTYRRIDRVPPVDLVERVGEVVRKHGSVMRAALDALLEHLAGKARTASQASFDSLTRLEKMRSGLGERGGDLSEFTEEWPGPS